MKVFDEWTEETPLEEAVFQAIGAGSMCWDYPEKAGIFNSDQAKSIAEDLLDLIHMKEGGDVSV